MISLNGSTAASDTFCYNIRCRYVFVLYPSFIPGPVLLPPHSTYISQDLNKFWIQTQYIPLESLNNYPHTFGNYGPESRRKRSVKANETPPNTEILSHSNSDDTGISAL